MDEGDHPWVIGEEFPICDTLPQILYFFEEKHFDPSILDSVIICRFNVQFQLVVSTTPTS